MHVFYQSDLSPEEICLSEEESKHCVRVLRLKVGDEVHLADGKGGHVLAAVKEDHPKRCLLRIVKRIHEPQPRSYYLHMMVAPTKNTERLEWFIEKATEAGIDKITFIETTNSERSKVNMERCKKIAISAMKQSKQWWLPEIVAPVKLESVLKSLETNTLKLIGWCNSDKSITLSSQVLKNAETIVDILIGPEGDFTPQEIEQAQKSGFIPVSLGANILRTETAALYACMAVKAIRER